MLSIFFIGMALSMDAFSLALGLGILKLSKIKKLITASLVGIMHFSMPLLGVFISEQLSFIFKLNFKILIILIFIYAGIMMLLDRKNNKQTMKCNYFNIFLLSFSVSFDSFTVGLGLKAYNINIILPSCIFLLCSFVVTYIGLIIGEYSVKHLKEKSLILGSIIFFLLAFVNLIDILLN